MRLNHSSAEVAARLALDEFPRSARYDPFRVLENLMGPNPLWLPERARCIVSLMGAIMFMEAEPETGWLH